MSFGIEADDEPFCIWDGEGGPNGEMGDRTGKGGSDIVGGGNGGGIEPLCLNDEREDVDEALDGRTLKRFAPFAECGSSEGNGARGDVNAVCTLPRLRPEL